MPTKIPQDNESRSDATMYDVITIPEEVEELLWEAASGLKGRTEVQTGRKGQLFEFDVTDECIGLGEAFSKARVCTRELA